MDFAVLDGEKGALMRAEIEKAGASGDSVGGVLQTAVYGMPAGVGEPWIDTVESIAFSRTVWNSWNQRSKFR